MVSCFSSGLLISVNTPSIASMEGIMKPSAPNTIKHSRDKPRPKNWRVCRLEGSIDVGSLPHAQRSLLKTALLILAWDHP